MFRPFMNKSGLSGWKWFFVVAIILVLYGIINNNLETQRIPEDRITGQAVINSSNTLGAGKSSGEPKTELKQQRIEVLQEELYPKNTNQLENQTPEPQEKVCVPDTLSCNGNYLKKCKYDGSGWVNYYTYCSAGCVEGKCKPTCTSGYTEEKRCSGNSLEFKYQYSNCSYDWVHWENCEYGCRISGECNQQPLSSITETQCTDSDGGKNYYIKGHITHTDGTKEYDECSTGAYIDYVLEHYCTTSGTGTLNYKCPYGCSDGSCNLEFQKTTITVLYVSDGDTIRLSSGEDVRLIGLNAPELGQSCSTEATNKLKTLVLGKEVILEHDVDNKDQYGRLLGYVYVGNTFVNLEMVRLGFAHKYEYGQNTKYSSQFEQAENEAKQNNGCLWQSSEENYIQDQCIYIYSFHYDAAGDDNYNLNDEYVIFGNRCSYSVDLSGWTVKDETASHLYTFPTFTFQLGAYITLYTGIGAGTSSSLYFGRSSGNYAAIWNNEGDTLYLRDDEGSLVLAESY